MQFLLTAEEYDKLVNDNVQREHEREKVIQKLCTEVANHKPIKWGWGRPDEPRPWGCIHTKKGEWYCDSCPVQDVCPSPKEWSK